MRPLSAGTTVVAHQRGADGHGRFLLLQDTAIQLDFDPLTPAKVSGTRAAELAAMVNSVGFGTGGDPRADTAAAFALTERLTGTEMTQDLLRSTRTCSRASSAPIRPERINSRSVVASEIGRAGTFTRGDAQSRDC